MGTSTWTEQAGYQSMKHFKGGTEIYCNTANSILYYIGHYDNDV